MLITKELDIKIVYKNLEYFNNKGFNVKNGDTITIDIKDLSNDSHRKVEDEYNRQWELLYSSKDLEQAKEQYNFYLASNKYNL